MTEIVEVPDYDVLGHPTGPHEQTRTEWAVVIDGPFNGAPGPHVLGVQEDEAEALERLAVWQLDRPTANARLIRREVVERAGPWAAL